MYGRISEQIFYSFPPKPATQTRHRIGKTGTRFLNVPGLHEEITVCGCLLEIPQPHGRVQPKTQGRRFFRPLSFPRLWLLATEQLLGVLERLFDGPTVVVAFQHLGGSHGQIGGEEKVVLFPAIWISTDDQKNRIVTDLVPQHHASIHPTGDGFASLAKGHGFPALNMGRHRFQRGQFVASLAGSAALFLLWFGRQIVQIRIAPHPRNHSGFVQRLSGQRGEKPVSNDAKPPFGEPSADFVNHLFGQLEQIVVVFPVQSQVDRQPQWFAAPGRLNWINRDSYLL